MCIKMKRNIWQKSLTKKKTAAGKCLQFRFKYDIIVRLMHKICCETRGCGCVPGIRAEHVPLDGRIEIWHCVCEKLRNRRTLVEGGGRVILRALLSGKPFSEGRRTFCVQMQGTFPEISRSCPMQGILAVGVFYGIEQRKHAGEL